MFEPRTNHVFKSVSFVKLKTYKNQAFSTNKLALHNTNFVGTIYTQALSDQQRASPVQLARKQNAHLFSRFTDEKGNIALCMAQSIPSNKTARILLCNQWPMHVARIFFRGFSL